MSKSERQVGDLHTPDELLAGARQLLGLSGSVAFRAVVLESITALEAFVQQRVFAALSDKLDPLLVEWLENKTRMDFDSRLSVLTPVATGLPVSEQADLWTRYKVAKRLRNMVTHSGRKVSQAEAEETLKTVHDWLAYLASSAEMDTALAAFKSLVESGSIVVRDGASATSAIVKFFSETTPAKAALERNIGIGRRADVILRFGERLVVVEAKFLRTGGADLVSQGLQQLEAMIALTQASRGVLVLFTQCALAVDERDVAKLKKGMASVVQIRVPGANSVS